MPDKTTNATIANELQSIVARLTKLETFKPGGMTLLGQAHSAGTIGGLTFYAGSGFQYLSGGDVPQVQFTIIRPVPVFVIGNFCGWGGTGGTASYTYVRLALLANSTDTVGANHINGVEMRGRASAQTNGSGLANSSSSFCFTPPPGTYYASFGYTMLSGATTTLGVIENDISVFQLSG